MLAMVPALAPARSMRVMYMTTTIIVMHILMTTLGAILVLMMTTSLRGRNGGDTAFAPAFPNPPLPPHQNPPRNPPLSNPPLALLRDQPPLRP